MDKNYGFNERAGSSKRIRRFRILILAAYLIGIVGIELLPFVSSITIHFPMLIYPFIGATIILCLFPAERARPKIRFFYVLTLLALIVAIPVSFAWVMSWETKPLERKEEAAAELKFLIIYDNPA